MDTQQAKDILAGAIVTNNKETAAMEMALGIIEGTYQTELVALDVIKSERDGLVSEKDALIKERDALIKERDGLIEEVIL